jgi:hypothetical protein
VAGRFEHMKLGGPHHQLVSVLGRRVDLDLLRRTHPQPACLYVQHFLQFRIVGVHVHRRARGQLELLRAADMIDVRVRNYDSLHREPVPLDDLQNARNIVPRVHHQRFPALDIAENRAVALQHSHREDFMDHTPIVYSTVWVTCSA